MNLPALFDGTIRFKLQPLDGGEATDHSLDLMCLELACQEVVKAHNLQVGDDGNYQHTSEFLKSLAEKLRGLDVPGCTPTVAYQLWLSAGHHVSRLKKNMSDMRTLQGGSESAPSGPATKSDQPDLPTGAQNPVLPPSSVPGCC